MHKLTGTVRAVLVARQAHTTISERQDQVNVSLDGFEGDRHSGLMRPADSRTPFYKRGTPIRNTRQVSLVSEEELAQVAAELGLPELRPEWVGANLLVSGIPAFSLLPAITRLFFSGGAVLLTTGENLPCSGMGRDLQKLFPDVPGLAEGFPRSALHRRGLVAVVEHPGLICQGDEIQIH